MVSVVIPAYNVERWLGGTMQSVLSQTYQDLEIIVVDDGSTDRTAQVVEAIKDERVSCIRQENRGLSGARNTGILAARGRYVALLDADDLFKPEKLERQVAVLDQCPSVGLVTCGFELIDEAGSHLGEERNWLSHPRIDLNLLLFWNPLLPSTLLIRRQWFDRVGLFDETLRRYEDWDLPIRLASAGCRMEYVEEILLSYRRHSFNMSTAVELVPVATRDAVRFMTSFFERPDIPESIRMLRGKALANVYMDAAARAYGAGLGPQGCAWLERATRGDDAGLLQGDPPKWAEALWGYALGTLVADWKTYLRTVEAHLPALPHFQGWNMRRLTAGYLAARAFKMNLMGRRRIARLSALHAIAMDPMLVANRGLLVLGVRPW
jgi:glycosyltransferase involved in cell wall biosynthesis